MNADIVDARPDHVPFVAWVTLTAFRSHLEKGLWDFFVGGPDDECLRFLEALATTETRHSAHYSNFIVAEREGQPRAALCGYFEDECGGTAIQRGTIEAAHKLGWSNDRIAEGWQRAISITYISLERAPGSWIIENVATRPECRRQGLIDGLLTEMLDCGRKRGATTAEIGIFIGNDAAQRTYEKAGFAVVAEWRNPEFEAVYKCPGSRLLRRPL